METLSAGFQLLLLTLCTVAPKLARVDKQSMSTLRLYV